MEATTKDVTKASALPGKPAAISGANQAPGAKSREDLEQEAMEELREKLEEETLRQINEQDEVECEGQAYSSRTPEPPYDDEGTARRLSPCLALRLIRFFWARPIGWRSRLGPVSVAPRGGAISNLRLDRTASTFGFDSSSRTMYFLFGLPPLGTVGLSEASASPFYHRIHMS